MNGHQVLHKTYVKEYLNKSVNYDPPGECSPEKDYLFDNLSRSHHQSQVNCEWSVDVISLWPLS